MESIIKGRKMDTLQQLDTNTRFSPNYTYHHLRRDMYDLCDDMGVKPVSRYFHPSAHITIARFVTADDFLEEEPTGKVNGAHKGDEVEEDPRPVFVHGVSKIQKWIDAIEQINQFLIAGFWPHSSSRSHMLSKAKSPTTRLGGLSSIPLTPITPAYTLSPLTPLTRTRVEPAGEWVIGRDAILDCRYGTNWYGGGENPLPELEHLCGRVWASHNGDNQVSDGIQVQAQGQLLLKPIEEDECANGNNGDTALTATVSLKLLPKVSSSQ